MLDSALEAQPGHQPSGTALACGLLQVGQPLNEMGRGLARETLLEEIRFILLLQMREPEVWRVVLPRAMQSVCTDGGFFHYECFSSSPTLNRVLQGL